MSRRFLGRADPCRPSGRQIGPRWDNTGGSVDCEDTRLFAFCLVLLTAAAGDYRAHAGIGISKHPIVLSVSRSRVRRLLPFFYGGICQGALLRFPRRERRGEPRSCGATARDDDDRHLNCKDLGLSLDRVGSISPFETSTSRPKMEFSAKTTIFLADMLMLHLTLIVIA